MSRWPKDQSLRFWSRVAISDTGCWLWNGITYPVGYGKLFFNGEDQGAHRVSWYLKNGPIPSGKCVLHKCDVRLCVNPDHLFLGTKKQNSQDMVSKGRGNTQKLSPTDIVAIRKSNLDTGALSAKYGITFSAMWKIRTKKTWKHV